MWGTGTVSQFARVLRSFKALKDNFSAIFCPKIEGNLVPKHAQFLEFSKLLLPEVDSRQQRTRSLLVIAVAGFRDNPH